MKLIKGLTLLSFLVIISGSCFDPPEFPVVPEIEFDRIEFIPAPSPYEQDTLNLYIHFKDGNGNLGLSKSSEDNSDPFHNAYFYQENNGAIEPLATVRGFIESVEYDLLKIPDPEKGKLVFFRTRLKPGYNFLPPGDICSSPPGGAVVYKYYQHLIGLEGRDGRRVLIESDDRIVLDDFVTLVDSFPRESPEYYQIQDTLYYTPNQNHYNIEVDFLVKDPTAPGGFKEFDWRQEYCNTFDGRFSTEGFEKPKSVDGTLRYSMTSFGLKTLFSIKTLKLRVSIKDRDLNRSNVIETPEFTLL